MVKRYGKSAVGSDPFACTPNTTMLRMITYAQTHTDIHKYTHTHTDVRVSMKKCFAPVVLIFAVTLDAAWDGCTALRAFCAFGEDHTFPLVS